MQSKGVVWDIIERRGEFLVAFGTHDGIFRVQDGALKKRVRRAHADKEEISFTFDRDLNILAISDDPAGL